MLGFISFGFKIIFASILGGALNYIPGKEENNQHILTSSLICVFATSVLGLTCQFPVEGGYIAMGFGVLSVISVILAISKNLDIHNRILWLFSAVIGMIIGVGFILQACILCALIYLILQNSENILVYINKKPDEAGDTGAENISN